MVICMENPVVHTKYLRKQVDHIRVLFNKYGHVFTDLNIFMLLNN